MTGESSTPTSRRTSLLTVREGSSQHRVFQLVGWGIFVFFLILVPIALFALLVGGWVVSGLAWFSSALVAAVLVLPGLLAAGAELARRPTDLPRYRHAREIAGALARQLVREAFTLACLPPGVSRMAIDAQEEARILDSQSDLLRELFQQFDFLGWQTAHAAVINLD